MKRCLIVNLDRCSGCDSCIVACKYENGLTLGQQWNWVTDVGPFGEFPHVERYWLPKFCQQCENPACVAVCPTGASHRDEATGTVLIDQSICIGCHSCMSACPFGVRYFNEADNVAEKCTLCHQLTADDPTVQPPCCHNCPTGARLFGDLDDPESAASQELAKYSEDEIFTLPDEAGANATAKYILSPRIATWQGLV